VKRLICALAAVMAAGCSQEGSVTVHNRSGPDLNVRVDGASFYLDDGEVVTKPVDIGRKFIFGPDDRAVAVSGEGYCKWPFDDVVAVTDGRNTLIEVYGDAGYFDICNVSGHTLELYLSPCESPTWGDPLEMISDGYCTTWMVEEGCWDMLLVSIAGEYEELDVYIVPCDMAAYDIEPPQLMRASGARSKSFGAASVSSEEKTDLPRMKKTAGRTAP
jgi:hypothetical protein